MVWLDMMDMVMLWELPNLFQQLPRPEFNYGWWIMGSALDFNHSYNPSVL